MLQQALFEGVLEYFRSSPAVPPPIIHLSAHGNEDSIGLTNGEIIGWDDLRELLIPINAALEEKLLLCMSTCNGASGCAMAMRDDDLPFLAVVGNDSEPTWGETNIAYASFYHRFASGTPVRECVEAMKAASGNSKFVIISARRAREAYLHELQRREAIKQLRANLPQA